MNTHPSLFACATIASEPLLSVVTICYNIRAGFEATSASLMQQTSNDWEWLVKDGGSTDGTCEVIERLHPRISFYESSTDGGVYDAMNQAAAKAKGTWLVFMNAGDSFADAHVLASMAPLLRSSSADVLVGDCLRTWSDGRRPSRKYHPAVIDHHYLYGHTINHQSAFVRRSCFKHFGPYDTRYRLLADHDFFSRVVRGQRRIESCPVLVARYDMHGMTASRAASRLMKKEWARLQALYPLSFRLRWWINHRLAPALSRFPGAVFAKKDRGNS